MTSTSTRHKHTEETKRIEADHIKPLPKGGTNYIWNIQPLCRNCNAKKHATYFNDTYEY